MKLSAAPIRRVVGALYLVTLRLVTMRLATPCLATLCFATLCFATLCFATLCAWVPSANASPLVHPRRAWLQLSSGERVAAIALDADSVWAPSPPAPAQRCCTPRGQCTPILVVRSSYGTPAPLPGSTFKLQQSLFDALPWPTRPRQEAALVAELRRDPELLPLLETYLPPVPPATSFGLPDFANGRAPVEPPYRWEASISAASLARRNGETTALGLELGFGFAIGEDWEHPSELVFGDSYGLRLRLAWYPTTANAVSAHDEGLMTWSVSPELGNVIDPFTQSRLRIPSLLGLVTPELGWMHHRDWQSAFVRWNLGPAALISYHWGLELRPNGGVVYDGPHGEADWFFGVGLGLLLRVDAPSE